MSLKQLTELLALCANYKVYYHVTIDKAFVIPHLDYGDTLYKQAFNNSFHDRLESIQYNACLAITGAIRGTFREKLYQELGLEPIRLRRWYRKLCLFYKVFKNEHPQYLFHLIRVRHSSYTSRNVHIIPIFSVKHIHHIRYILSLNGINWILPFAILKAYLYLEKIFLIS